MFYLPLLQVRSPPLVLPPKKLKDPTPTKSKVAEPPLSAERKEGLSKSREGTSKKRQRKLSELVQDPQPAKSRKKPSKPKKNTNTPTHHLKSNPPAASNEPEKTVGSASLSLRHPPTCEMIDSEGGVIDDDSAAASLLLSSATGAQGVRGAGSSVQTSAVNPEHPVHLEVRDGDARHSTSLYTPKSDTGPSAYGSLQMNPNSIGSQSMSDSI